MWIFLSDAFLSIVECQDGFPAGDSRNRLLVRARAPDDITNVFPSAVVEHTPDADYAYRTVLRRAEVGKVLTQRLYHVNYSNFKNSVRDHDRHGMLLRIWTAAVDFFRTGMYAPGRTHTVGPTITRTITGRMSKRVPAGVDKDDVPWHSTTSPRFNPLGARIDASDRRQHSIKDDDDFDAGDTPWQRNT